MLRAPRDDAAVISLTFDDALPEHLHHVVPLLDDVGLTATFYVPLSAPCLSNQLDEWRRAAVNGHELGAHTIFHPMAEGKASATAAYTLESYTVDRMRLELRAANQWLEAVDGRRERSFAYPGSNPTIGARGWIGRSLVRLGLRDTRWPGLAERAGLDVGSTRRSYRELLPELYVSARAGGVYIEDTAPALGDFGRYALASAAVNGHSFDEVRGFVERALARGSWAILQFHGVGGGHRMDCDLDCFRRLVFWLREHHAVQVTTVVDGSRRLFGVHNAKVSP